MKYIILTITMVLSLKTVVAQKQNFVKISLPVKLSLKEKKEKFAELYTQSVSVYIEGYDGEDVSIEPYTLPQIDNLPAEAAGLNDKTALIGKAIYGPPTESYITENPDYLRVNIGTTDYKALLIKVPRHIHLKLYAIGALPGNKLSIKNFDGMLEVSSPVPLVEISNITGPLTLNSNYTGESKIKITDVKWDAHTPATNKHALYISSFSSNIDISVPENLKATFMVVARNGDLYSDLNIPAKFPESNGQNTFVSDMNGGGILIGVITEYGNVFLRKEK